MTAKTVCVFCGSSSGTDPAFVKAAERLGELFHENSWGLVYGGGTTGLMGAIARTIASRGGNVEGIIPEALIGKEREGKTPEEHIYGKTTLVKDMHTRKRLMGQQADAFVALPGGFGTAEELFEITTWNQLGIHDRPIVILNTNGFYNGLIAWIESAVENGFISPACRHIIVSVTTPEEVIHAIANYKVASGRLNLNWGDQSPTKF
ncbi:hypothetical protein TRVA0_006S01178 [Trichomonascus vanleenenianus]|uniref:Log1p n=1 Tax=Trichomonascus vanleenenianus TaxID=2268995 RepID=UPI003ECAB146